MGLGVPPGSTPPCIEVIQMRVEGEYTIFRLPDPAVPGISIVYSKAAGDYVVRCKSKLALDAYLDTAFTQAKQEEVMAKKEIGIPKGAPKAAKRADERADKAKGIKEGSPKDLAMDRSIMKKFGKKGK